MTLIRRLEPFLPDEQAEYAAKVLEQSIDRVVERTKLKSKHHMVLRDACVDSVTRRCISTLTRASSPVWVACRAKSAPNR